MSSVDELIGALLSDEAYATGRRAYPRTLTLDDAAAISEVVNHEVDRGTAARDQAAERDGVKIACHRGCNGCCEEMILVYRGEAELIARWLARPENAATRERFLAAYPAWRAAAGDGPERLPALVAAGDADGYLAAHIEQWRRRVLCAFNHDGDCTIYPVRPAGCRNGHAVDTAELCSGANVSGRSAVRLRFKPLDDFMVTVGRIERAVHHAVGGARRRPAALCDAVYRKLTGGG